MMYDIIILTVWKWWRDKWVQREGGRGDSHTLFTLDVVAPLVLYKEKFVLIISSGEFGMYLLEGFPGKPSYGMLFVMYPHSGVVAF